MIMPLKVYHYKIRLMFLLAFVAYLLMACGVLPTVTVNQTPIISGPATPQLDTWYQGGKGVQVRYEDWKDNDGDEDTVTIARFDLHDVALSVAYQPTQPLSMGAWMQQEQATAIINGGYFDSNDVATALVITNGHVSGQSYQGFGGMLSVNAQRQTTLRSLAEQPYDPDADQLTQAVQSSPMLVLHGKKTSFSADSNGARRSVVAMDTQGRLLLIASPGGVFSLQTMAQLLVSSDLSIETALNLDGGASTGLYVNAGSQHVTIDAINDLPLVIVVKHK
jgi:uncharacterized protein YigE (DUF2233 family)